MSFHSSSSKEKKAAQQTLPRCLGRLSKQSIYTLISLPKFVPSFNFNCQTDLLRVLSCLVTQSPFEIKIINWQLPILSKLQPFIPPSHHSVLLLPYLLLHFKLLKQIFYFVLTGEYMHMYSFSTS